MSYQVLARKWRPQSFEDMVGQEHVLRTLVNSLTNNKIHHAYLFTGTRGVGKTTVARVFAKCLVCETGVTVEPCQNCSACKAITAGNYVDLIEVDAASRTKVEDTRELLENVQYMPTRGRYKIYLIDEVHMLSGHSFNALLKTLEEPPEYVKFLLATTEPRRLPITVLSRCLQFHLKELPAAAIAAHLEHILVADHHEFDRSAVDALAIAAKGSLRDALSLLDQAIAYGNGCVGANDVGNLLGTIERAHIEQILRQLAARDGSALFKQVAAMSELSYDFTEVLSELISYLRYLALVQVVPDALPEDLTRSGELHALAKTLSAQDVQLFYQIALLGRRDLPLVPDPRVGFEMILLRMLAFYPIEAASLPIVIEPTARGDDAPPVAPVVPSNASSVNKEEEQQVAAVPSPSTAAVAAATEDTAESHNEDALQWADIIEQLQLDGVTRSLANQCVLKRIQPGLVELILAPSFEPLLNARQTELLSVALSSYFGRKLKVKVHVQDCQQVTPAAQYSERERNAKAEALALLQQDSKVRAIVDTFDATLDEQSMKLITD